MKGLLRSGGKRIAELRRADPKHFRFLIGGTAAALVFAAVLLSLDAPWEGEVAKRIAAGKDLRVTDYAILGSWYAAAVNLSIVLGLLITSRWWWRWTRLPDSGPPDKIPPATRSRPVRLLAWLGLAAALALALWIRVPQVNRYLMFDEQDNLRRSIYGYAETDSKSGEPVFVKASWTHAFFENKFANNPVLHSVASKASLTAWQKYSGKGEQWFSRPALRFPSLIGGVLSIAAFWGFLFLLGMPLSAVLAAFILALHPFHIDYSIQSRGYGLMFLFVGTSCICALLALRSGRWRWFAGLGLSLALVLGCFSGATYFVMAFGGALAVLLGWRGFVLGESGPRALLVRLLVAGIISGGLYLQLIAPSYPQMKEWLVGSFSRASLGTSWLTDIYTQYTTGAWFGAGRAVMEESVRPDIFAYLYETVVKTDLSYTVLVLAVIPFFTVLGFVRMWRMGGAARTILLGGCLAPVVAYCFHEFITHLWLHGWYLLYFLPFFAIMLGVGLAGAARWLAGRIPAVGAATAAVLLAGFLAFFWAEVRPGQFGRIPQDRSPDDPHTGQNFTVYPRGRSNWVVYGEGRMVRQPVEDKIHESFPFEGLSLPTAVRP